MKKFTDIDFDALGKFLLNETPKDEKEKQEWEENCKKFQKEYEETYLK